MAAAVRAAHSARARRGARRYLLRDDSGRIVKRRLPGTVEVPCPTTPATPQPGTPGAPEGTTPPAEAGAEGTPITRAAAGRIAHSAPRACRLRRVRCRCPIAGASSMSSVTPTTGSIPTTATCSRPISPSRRLVLQHGPALRYHLHLSRCGIGRSASPPPHVRASNDVFGHPGGYLVQQNVDRRVTLYKGDTVFKPPDWSSASRRCSTTTTPRWARSGLVNVNPDRGETRSDNFVGLQNGVRREAPAQRVGALRLRQHPRRHPALLHRFPRLPVPGQPARASPLRHRDNNRVSVQPRLLPPAGEGHQQRPQRRRQAAAPRRHRSGQSLPAGHAGHRLHLAGHRGLQPQPRKRRDAITTRTASWCVPRRSVSRSAHDYNVNYLGYNGDGHFGRYNADRLRSITRPAPRTPGMFCSWLGATSALLRRRRNFARLRLGRALRLSLLYASGDRNPYDRRRTGFDAIFENPQFAGGDTSYWISQAVPLIGGGGVTLTPAPTACSSTCAPPRTRASRISTIPGSCWAGSARISTCCRSCALAFNLNDLVFRRHRRASMLRAQPAQHAELHRRGRVRGAHLPAADVAEHRAARVVRASSSRARLQSALSQRTIPTISS